MTRPLRIAGVISSLQCGGAERVMTTLCNAWSADHRVTLFTFSGAEQPPFFAVAPSVVVRPLNLLGTSRSRLHGAWANLKRVFSLRRALSATSPDVVVSFGDQTNVIALLAGVGRGWPVVVSERSDPRNFPMSRAWAALRRLAYRRAAAIVLVAQEGRQWFGRALAERIHVIQNPLNTMSPRRSNEAPAPDGVVALVTVGRLAPEKGMDVLLHALHLLPSDLADRWTLTVVGDGPDRHMLMRLADDLKVSDRIRWAGLVSDPSPYLETATVFVLPSRFEGFPNALAEAMALGRTVLSTDCRSGPRELITDGVNGLLVSPDDPEVMARGLERLLRDPALRTRLAGAAPTATRELSIESIGLRWVRLFADVIGQGGGT